jgi:hypothetical protein
MQPLYIERMSAWTPFGGLLQATTGFRAGLSRASFVGPGAPGGGDTEFVAHLCVQLGGYEGFARQKRMLELALSGVGPGPGPNDAVFVLCSETRTAFLSSPTAKERLAKTVAPQAEVVVGNRSAAFALLAQVQKVLVDRSAPAAWLIAVDSLLDEERLAGAISSGRLRTEENPTGLFVGEAAVALRFVSKNSPNAPASISAWSSETASQKGPPRLTTSARRVLSAETPVAHIHVDIDGTESRARTWGTSVAANRALLSQGRTWIPHLCFGETGAAAIPLSIALAAARRLPGSTLVTCLGDDRIGCVIVDKPN